MNVSSSIPSSNKILKRIRISWKINGVEGHGLPFAIDRREFLENWCIHGNSEHGHGTHWIEEIEV